MDRGAEKGAQPGSEGSVRFGGSAGVGRVLRLNAAGWEAARGGTPSRPPLGSLRRRRPSTRSFAAQLYSSLEPFGGPRVTASAYMPDLVAPEFGNLGGSRGPGGHLLSNARRPALRSTADVGQSTRRGQSPRPDRPLVPGSKKRPSTLIGWPIRRGGGEGYGRGGLSGFPDRATSIVAIRSDGGRRTAGLVRK